MDRKVHLPNGETILVTHSGSCRTPGGGLLENILVIPAFKFDLLLVSQLTRQLKCSVNFFPKFFVFQDLSNRRVKGIGKELGVLQDSNHCVALGPSLGRDRSIWTTTFTNDIMRS